MRILDLVSGRKKPEAKAAAAETKNPEPADPKKGCPGEPFQKAEDLSPIGEKSQPEPEALAISSTVEGIAAPIAPPLDTGKHAH